MESLNMSCTIFSFLLIFLAASFETTPSNLIKGDECGAKAAEIFFLLDSSSSIWPVDFDKQLNFVKKVVKSFEIGPNKTHVGVASFSHRYHVNFALDKYNSLDEIEAAVGRIPQYLGGTETNIALDGVRTKGLSKQKVRPGIARILIVVTDGESYDPKKTKEAATRVKDDGIVVFAVGVGSQTNADELTSIASTPKHSGDKYLFKVDNFDGLDDTLKETLTTKACKVEVQDDDTGPACGARNMADVMFLVDPTEFGAFHTQQIYDFIGNVVNDFNMEKGNIKVGLESRNCVGANITLGQYKNSRDLAMALRATKLSGLPQMLKRLRTHSFMKENGTKYTARHMAVVFVDDRLFDIKTVLEEARRTKKYDVELFVVAIGDSIVDDELKALCSSPVERHIIRVPSYETLLEFKPEFTKKFCHGL